MATPVDPASDSTRPTLGLPVLAGLTCGAAVAWLCFPVGLIHSLLALQIFLIALGYSAGIWVAAAAGAILVLVSRKQMRTPAVHRTVLAIAATAAWFAPLACFASTRSIWAVATAAAFAVSLTRLMWRLRLIAPRPREPRARVLFAESAPTVFEPQLGAAFCASVFLQLGTVAIAAGSTVQAAILLAAPAAILTWRATAKGWLPDPRNESLRRSWIRTSLLAELAMVLTTVALFSNLVVTGGSGAQQVAASQDGQGATAEKNESGPYAGTGKDLSESHPGVILWPEVQKHAVLVPPLPSMRSSIFNSHESKPLSIPFFGVYWMYNPPDRRPPKNSVTVTGSPEAKSFHSADGRLLTMEAHQNLGKLIDMSCCSRLDVEVKNADPYARTVSLEVTLINSTLGGKPEVTLGVAEVKSKPTWAYTREMYAKAEPTRETLSFSFPATAPFAQFDELSINFRRLSGRGHKSAKVGIERFILIPRGL